MIRDHLTTKHKYLQCVFSSSSFTFSGVRVATWFPLEWIENEMNIIHQNVTWTEQDCWKVLTRLVGLVSDSMESLIFFLVTTCIRMSINGNCSYLLIFSVVIYQQAIDFKDLDKFLYKLDIISYIIEANLVINALSDLVNGVH